MSSSLSPSSVDEYSESYSLLACSLTSSRFFLFFFLSPLPLLRICFLK